jgi:hypothetical protein
VVFRLGVLYRFQRLPPRLAEVVVGRFEQRPAFAFITARVEADFCGDFIVALFRPVIDSEGVMMLRMGGGLFRCRDQHSRRMMLKRFFGVHGRI